MKYFVLVYSRDQGRILDVENYTEAEADRALERRFELDRVHRGDANTEVVLLSAESEEALKLTHGRYFRSVEELAKPA